MAYEITWEDVKNVSIELVEELEEFTPAQKKLVLDAAIRQVPENRYLTDTFEARVYLAAHLSTINMGPAAGEGTQNNVGIDSFSSSVTLAVNNPAAKNGILATVFGREFYRLQQQNFTGFYVG